MPGLYGEEGNSERTTALIDKSGVTGDDASVQRNQTFRFERNAELYCLA